MILHPAALIRPMKGVGSPKDSITAAGVACHVESRRIAFERPRDEANADPAISRLAELLADRRRIGLARADHTEAAGVGDGEG